MLAYDYPLLGAIWTILVFAAVVCVVWFIIWCLYDNFRRRDHSGWAKLGWTVLILFLPLLGSLIYILARPADPDAVIV